MAQNVSKSCSLRYQKTCKNRCFRCFSPSLAHTSAARKCSIPTSFWRNFVAKWPVWLPIRAATRVNCRILWKPFADSAQQNGRDCHATSPILLIEMVHITCQSSPYSEPTSPIFSRSLFRVPRALFVGEVRVVFVINIELKNWNDLCKSVWICERIKTFLCETKT